MTTTIDAAAPVIERELGARASVDVQSLDIEIRLRGTDGTTGRVRLLGGDLDEEFRLAWAPGRLTIRPVRRWPFGWRRGVGSLELEVPRDAAVRAQSASGAVRALDLVAGGNFRSASGDIELAGLGGDIDASSVSGSLRIRAVEPVTLRVRTTSGRIDVVAPRATRLDAHTVSGSVQVAGRFGGDGPYSLDSVSGALTIATDTAIRLVASTLSGRVHSEAPQGVSVVRGRTTELSGDGPLVGARTVSGDVRVVPLPSTVASDQSAAAPELVPAVGDPSRGAWPIVEPGDAAPSAHDAAVTETSPSPSASASEPAATDLEGSRLAILRALERGEIDVAEAVRRLEALEVDRA